MKPHPTRGRRLPVEILEPHEIAALINACTRGATGLRNRALIIVLWRAGLRISEALALRPKDIDLQAGTLQVLHGKGDKQRVVAIDPETVTVLGRWLETRRRIPGMNGGPVFCALHGAQLQTAYIRELLPRLARKAGVDKRVHPHAFRHVHACELLRERIPINLIQRQLGHSSIAVTSRYLAHVNPPELTEAMSRRVFPTEVAEALKPHASKTSPPPRTPTSA